MITALLLCIVTVVAVLAAELKDDRLYTYDELRTMNYQEYLNTPHWERVKTEAFRVYGRECAICGSNYVLQVHHKTYEHRGDEENHLEDLMVLCRDCHEKMHSERN
jgi:5-methylcytosine-specific restriction endonuclease McrA